jgi:predicted nucleic acid-binding protein
MAQAVIADAGPLIALAGANTLEVLPRLFGEIWIPTSVKTECLVKHGADSQEITSALTAGWLVIKEVFSISITLSRSLGPGEADALHLARQAQNPLLILDDRLARREAARLQLAFIGTVRVLDLAEERGLIADAAEIIRLMRQNGYRIEEGLLQQIRQRKR